MPAAAASFLSQHKEQLKNALQKRITNKQKGGECIWKTVGMSQSYALTVLPTEIRALIGGFLDYKTAHRRKMTPVFAVLTIRTDNSIERAVDSRYEPLGWRRNGNLIRCCHRKRNETLWRCFLRSLCPEELLDPHHEEYFAPQRFVNLKQAYS